MLCVSPDGVLWNLPFQALRIDGKRYLIDDYAIFYAPSLSVLRDMSRSLPAEEAGDSKTALKGESKDPRKPVLLAFGDPVLEHKTRTRGQALHNETRFRPLPEAAEEVKRLKKIYPVGQSKI